MIHSHKDLVVYQKSINLVLTIYKLCQGLPNNEKFGIISQLQRAIVSVPSNIAEGASRGSSKEYKRFLSISLGSLSEVECLLEIAQKLQFISYEAVPWESCNHIRRMLIQLRKKLP